MNQPYPRGRKYYLQLIDRLTFYYPFYSENGPICLSAIYKIPGFSKPGITPCLPNDARLIHDPVEDEIAENVDTLELTNSIAIVLLVLELIVASVTLTALCVKTVRSNPSSTSPRIARVANHRNTVYEAEIDPIRV